VTIAYDGLQAWSTALRRKPDAIIPDIHMPAGTGFEVLRKLKTSTKTPRIPVIVVSGSVNADTIEAIETLGGTGSFANGRTSLTSSNCCARFST
jgi:CheY-like chemotaxis protein